MERVQFSTADGVVLDGDLHLVEESRSTPIVLCHPHPDFGGDRFHPLLTALFSAAAERHRPVLRFDFRRTGELRPVDDLAAALDALDDRVGHRPVDVIGYSFGAVAALSSDDERLRSIVAIAPPELPVDQGRRVLILVPQHDQFMAPGVIEDQTAAWDDVTVETISGTDHFLSGRLAWIVDTAMDWLDRPGAR